ncbi:autotransporter domain-containing protein [Cetobacterium somerae]|uniref:autotransporter domain-containing protein n=1 Tax=Cetobacterium sp. NK01 TaxID=2993530 RepID=UPI002116BF9D|nr:autotransporter domain-containing protein [Cetobacterium sp. NK01]MCQ8212069.1 autotransporter domain-containing protein [Cetobacterium sp. NK01]
MTRGIFLVFILFFQLLYGSDKKENKIFIGKRYPVNLSLDSGWTMSYIQMDTNLKSGLRTPKLKSDEKVNVAYLRYSEDLIGFSCENLNESLNSNLKNHFFGGVGKVSKKIKVDSLYLEPMGKIQSMAVFQRSINENYGNYNVSLDNLNGILNTFYLGMGVGKQYFQESHIVDFSMSAGVRQELNRIDEDVKNRMKSLVEESERGDLKDKNDFSQEFGLNGAIGNPATGVSFYTGYKYFFSEDESWKVTAGVSYIF